MIGLLVLGTLALWLTASVWIARRLARAIPMRPTARPWVAVGLFVIVFLLPVADEVGMRPWFIGRCHEAAVMKVNAEGIRGRKVIVTAEPKNGWVGGTLLPVYYSHIEYRDATTSEVLAEYGTYSARGGFLSRAIGSSEPLTGTFYCAPEERRTAPERYGFTVLN
jgi:hypothetical protein